MPGRSDDVRCSAQTRSRVSNAPITGIHTTARITKAPYELNERKSAIRTIQPDHGKLTTFSEFFVTIAVLFYLIVEKSPRLNAKQVSEDMSPQTQLHRQVSN